MDAALILARAELPAAERPALVYLTSLTRGSRRTMRQALDTCARLLTGGRCDCEGCPWGLVRWQHTAALRGILVDVYAPATARKVLSALRGVLRAAWRLGQMTADELARALDWGPVRGETLPRGRALSADELRALFGACGSDVAGLRDAALLAVLRYAGLRRSEVCALELADWQPAAGALRVRHGKGRRERTVFVSPIAAEYIRAWLAARGEGPGPLFNPVRAAVVMAGGITCAGLYEALGRLARRAGVSGSSPHDLRRTFVSDLLDAGADIATVQRLAGHANVATTARYDRRGDETLRRAVGLLR